MKFSESINNLSVALTEVNKELKNPLNTAVNPFFKSNYAPLSEILTGIRPLLAKHGLSIIQNTTSENDKIGIQTIILHQSGQYLESDMMYIKADKDTAQGQGSAITYGRRYQLSAILSISSEDDDDGNNASNPQKQKSTMPMPKTQQNPVEAVKKAFEKPSEDLSKPVDPADKEKPEKKEESSKDKMLIEGQIIPDWYWNYSIEKKKLFLPEGCCVTKIDVDGKGVYICKRK